MELPKRKRIRLQNYDYSSNGTYFITVCTKNREQIFGRVVAEVGEDIILPTFKTRLTKTGEIVDRAINSINLHYPYARIDKYVIMPDHIHLLIIISEDLSDGRIISAPTVSNKKSLEIIIGQMKRWVSKQVGTSLWQKSFYDQIIRTDEDYNSVWSYIDSNPRLWFEGKDNH